MTSRQTDTHTFKNEKVHVLRFQNCLSFSVAVVGDLFCFLFLLWIFFRFFRSEIRRIRKLKTELFCLLSFFLGLLQLLLLVFRFYCIMCACVCVCVCLVADIGNAAQNYPRKTNSLGFHCTSPRRRRRDRDRRTAVCNKVVVFISCLHKNKTCDHFVVVVFFAFLQF